MKRLSHKHLVKIVGSYTDPECFAFLMEPVAQYNLSEYLQRIGSHEFPTLRKFFGCLANAITYLHDQQMHHMDIKLDNILVKGGEVFVGDFGTVNDFSRKERSTTWSAAPRTPRYMSPEIARDPHSPRNYATDIWSLGVVFLEMTAVLRGQSLQSFHSYLRTHGSQHKYVYGNLRATHSYFELLRTQGTGPEYDNEPLSWVKDMIHLDSTGRPTARAMRNQILHSSSIDQFRSFCCADAGQIWNASKIEPQQALPDEDESVFSQNLFFEANESFDMNHMILGSSNPHTINSWLNHNSSLVNPHTAIEIANANGEMPFDIEDDEETIVPLKNEKLMPSRIPSRLANFDFLDSSSNSIHYSTSKDYKRNEDELPYDIDDGDAILLGSDNTALSAVNTSGADAEGILQVLDNLDDIHSPSGQCDFMAPRVPKKIPIAASQASVETNPYSYADSGLITNKPINRLENSMIQGTLPYVKSPCTTETNTALLVSSVKESCQEVLVDKTSSQLQKPTGQKVSLNVEAPCKAKRDIALPVPPLKQPFKDKASSQPQNPISQEISPDVETPCLTKTNTILPVPSVKQSMKEVFVSESSSHLETSNIRSGEANEQDCTTKPSKQNSDILSSNSEKLPIHEFNFLTDENLLKLNQVNEDDTLKPLSNEIPKMSITKIPKSLIPEHSINRVSKTSRTNNMPKIPTPDKIVKEHRASRVAKKPLTNKISEVPVDTALGRYSAYIQNAWEVESSQATSAMSKATRRVLRSPPQLIVWQDNSLNLLSHYASVGKAEAVRQLLKVGCNPGTKVSCLEHLRRSVD